MIIDNQLVLSAEQDIIAISSSGNTTSTNTIVVGKADFGYKGCYLAVVARSAILAPATNGSVNIEVQACDESTFSTPTTIKTENVALGGAIAKDTLLTKFILRDVAGLKYVRIKFTGVGYVKNSSQSALKVDAFITFDYPTK